MIPCSRPSVTPPCLGNLWEKKLPETVDGDDLQKSQQLFYVAEVRTHNGPPKKEGFKSVSNMKFWKVILNIAHFKKKTFSKSSNTAGVPSMATPWTFASVGAFHGRESWMSKNSWAMKIKNPRHGAVSSTSSHCTQRLRFGIWLRGWCREKSLYRILKNGKLIHVCINASDLESERERERFEEFSVFNGLVIWYFYVGKSVQSVSTRSFSEALVLSRPNCTYQAGCLYLLLAVICFKDRPRGRRFSLTWWETCFVTVELMRLD